MRVALLVLVLMPLAQAMPHETLATPDPDAFEIPADVLTIEEAREAAKRLLPELPEGWKHAEALQGGSTHVDGEVIVRAEGVGDLDGDGRDDLIRQDYVYALGETYDRTITALRGPGLVDEIFSITGEGLMAIGDVTGDGFTEYATSTTEGNDTAGDDVYSILDGTTGDHIQTLRLPYWTKVTSHENRTPEVGPIIIERNAQSETRHHYEYPIAADGGFFIVSFELYIEHREEETPTTYSSSWDFGYENGIRRLDADGELLWERETGDGWSYSPMDLDLDGDLDIMAWNYEFREEGETFVVDASHQAIDGKDGKPRWTLSETQRGYFSFSMPWPSPRVHGEAPEMTYARPGPDAWTVDVLDASSGDLIDSRSIPRSNEGVGPYAIMGDIDGDGLHDVKIADGDTISLQRGDGTPFWATADKLATTSDLTGDGVRDFWLLEEDTGEAVIEEDDTIFELTLVDGSSGKQLWHYENDKAFDLELVDDLNGDGGADLLISLAPDADENTTSYHNETIKVQLLRGSDAARFWELTLYHPQEFVEVAAPRFYLSAHNAGDLNGNGGDDIAISMSTFFSYTVTCENTCTFEYIDRPSGDRLSGVRIYDAATGAQVFRADGMERTGYVARQDAQLDTAAQELQSTISGSDWWLPAVVIGAAAIVLVSVALVVRAKLR